MSKTAEEHNKEFDSMYGDHTPDLPASKAEQAALERFPVEMTRIPYQDLINAFGGKEFVDFNSMPRGYFQLGYEQALKELALSIDDIEKIHTFLYAVKNNKHGVFTFTRLSDEQYKEVLQRFINIKNEQRIQQQSKA